MSAATVEYAPYQYPDGARWALVKAGELLCAACDDPGASWIHQACAGIVADKVSGPGLAYVEASGRIIHYRCAPEARKHAHEIVTGKDDGLWQKLKHGKASTLTADNGDSGEFVYVGALLSRDRNTLYLIPWSIEPRPGQQFALGGVA